LPWLPERVVRSERVLQHLFRGTADASERLDPAVISAYAHALREPGAATAALNYYRAALRYPRRAQGPIAKPTLVVWGEKDPALTPRLLDGLQRYVPDLRVRRLAHAGHWVHQERPREVNEALLKFLPPPQKTAAADRSARLA
ncbi:MAG TPA: alpha/beta fold hydrolase, partial [Myxococcaceae bacterium]|nr:alpha/beta fold hydrolase [Myxococcaceae bacterium]